MYFTLSDHLLTSHSFFWHLSCFFVFFSFVLSLFLSLFSTASGCKCPVCMNTVWGWRCSPKGSASWRLPRKSFSAWRPLSSSASVSQLASCLNNGLDVNSASEIRRDYGATVLQKIYEMNKVWESYCCVLALWSQCRWRAWRTSAALMNCGPPTSRSWTAWPATTERPPVRRDCFSSRSCWTISSR